MSEEDMDASRSTVKRMKSDLACPLPDEIVEDILSRLPAKSLRRFQCVSRWFQATVASPVFQDAHYQRNKGKRRLFIKPLSRHREPLYAWQPSGAAVVEEIMSSSHLPQGSIFPVATKSCRGLVLLSCLEYHTHYVWNPSTREMLTLPDNIAARTPSRWPLVSYGLGYCSATQRHKVVRIYSNGGDHGRGGSSLPPPTVCEVFTLAESACWRPPAAATRPPQQHYPRQNGPQGAVFCNGNLYFLQAGGDIATFNVSDETFGSMILKPPPELQSCSNFEITELGGFLCVYTFTQWWSPPYQQESANTCAIWLLRQTGGWEKICSIDWGSMLQAEHAHLTSAWIGPLDMYSDGNDNQMKIMFATGYANVFSVDPSTGSLEILFSPEDTTNIIGGVGESCNNQLPTVGLFEDSLVRVGNAGESEWSPFSSPSVQAWSEVLSRLPSRTVGSLSQVCRGWRDMIKAGRFLAAHLCNANVHKSPEMMFFGGKPYGFTPVKDFIINGTRNNVPPLIDEGSNVVCSKPCHGLNAGSFPYFDFVCNPITGYFKALPLDRSGDLKGLSLYEFRRKVPLHAGDAMLAGRLGLGYEQETSRHVLVRLECTGSSMTTGHDYSRLEVECKMRYVEDMFWVKADPPPRPIGSKPPAYVNGKLYWMADTEPEQRLQDRHEEIVVLDISKRKFEVVQGPSPCSHDQIMSIFELQQELCVACSSHQSTDNVLIWAMDDKGSWFAKYHLELGRHCPEYSPELVTPLAVNPADGRILLSTGRAIGYYDPNTTELETIYRLGKHIIGRKFLPVLFQESLIKPHDPMF